MESKNYLHMAWGTILKIGLGILLFYTLFLIKDILVWLVFGIIISVLVDPAIDFMQQRGIPRMIAAMFAYLMILVSVSLLLYGVIPPFASEIRGFLSDFPHFFQKAAPIFQNMGIDAFQSYDRFLSEINNWLKNSSDDIFGGLISLFGGIMATVTIFALAFFISLEEKGIEHTIRLFAPKKSEDSILNVWNRSKVRISQWFGTRFITCVIMGFLVYIISKIIGIQYAASFGIFAGFFEIVPVLGPIFSGAVLALIAGINNINNGIIIVVSMLVLNQIEGNLITPLLMKKMVGLSSVLVLLAMLIGGRLWGPLGAVLSIPLAGIVVELSKEYLEKKDKVE